MLEEILEAGPEKVGKEFYEKSINQKEQGGASLDHGAKLASFLASPLSNGISGKLISAIWDKYLDWPLNKIRDDIGLEVDLLKAYYNIESKRYPNIKECTRNLVGF